MRKRLKKIITIFCMLFVFTFGSITSFAADGTIYLMGIVDPDGADRTSWMNATTGLSNLDASILKKTAFTSTNLKSYLDLGKMLVIQSHGVSNGVKCIDSSGNSQYLYSSSLASSNLSNLKICYLGACNTGYGGSSGSNLVNTVYGRGAKCVIGYTDSVLTKQNSFMLRSFCNHIGYGYGATDALSYSQTAVINSYGSYGNVNKRLMRGSSQTYANDINDTEIMAVNLENNLLPDVTNIENLQEILSYDESNFGKKQLQNSLKTTGEELYFDENGNCTGFYKTRTSLDQNVVTRQAAKDVLAISKEYLRELGLENKYTCGLAEYSEDIDLWTFVFYYYVDGIKTEDFVSMVFESDGRMISFAHPNSNIFEGVEIDNSIIDAINNNELLDREIKDSFANVDSYNVVECILRLTDEGTPYIDYTVKMLFDNSNTTLESIYIML